jgi:hypothetical protein
VLFNKLIFIEPSVHSEDRMVGRDALEFCAGAVGPTPEKN